MTIHPEKLRRVRVYKEVGSAAFGVDHSNTAGDFYDLPFIEAGFLKGKSFIPTGETQQSMDAMTKDVRGPDKPTMSLKYNMFTSVSGTQARNALAVMNDVIFEDSDPSPTDTVQGAGATTTVIPVTSGAAWQPGNGMAIVIGGVIYIREVKSITANNVTVKYAYPSAPSADALIMVCTTWFPGAGHYDSSTSPALQAIVDSAVDENQFAMCGGKPTGIAIDIQPGGIPTFTVDLEFALCVESSAGDLADATYGHEHLVAMDSEFRVAATSDTAIANAALLASSASFKLNIAYQSINTFGGVNTRAGYVRRNTPPVIEGDFMVPPEGEDFAALVDDRTAAAVTLQIGESTAAGCVMLSAPTVQLMSDDLVPIEDIQGQKVTWKGRLDENTTGGSNTRLNKAAFRLHYVFPTTP